MGNLKRPKGPPQRLNPNTAKAPAEDANHQVHFRTFGAQAFEGKGDAFHYKNHKKNACASKVAKQAIRL
jgi:hypothetical protein